MALQMLKLINDLIQVGLRIMDLNNAELKERQALEEQEKRELRESYKVLKQGSTKAVLSLFKAPWDGDYSKNNPLAYLSYRRVLTHNNGSISEEQKLTVTTLLTNFKSEHASIIGRFLYAVSHTWDTFKRAGEPGNNIILDRMYAYIGTGNEVYLASYDAAVTPAAEDVAKGKRVFENCKDKAHLYEAALLLKEQITEKWQVERNKEWVEYSVKASGFGYYSLTPEAGLFDENLHPTERFKNLTTEEIAEAKEAAKQNEAGQREKVEAVMRANTHIDEAKVERPFRGLPRISYDNTL